MKYDDRMDVECISICDAINSLPGLTTFESCCGHGRHPMWIFFRAKKQEDLAPLLNSLSYGWKINASISSFGKIYFLLEGPMDEADKIAREIGQRIYD